MISQRTRARRACMILSSWLAFVACLLFASAAVDATTYVYDANGRLVTVTNDAGESARYVYDVMGNMVRIERIAADELKIFAVTPTHGTVEAPVTIYGQGFSSQVSDNTVTFNGTVATIQSATANQLKVTVPFGATTGALTVKVVARSVTADDVFTVDDTGLPPTIASVAPDTIVAGAALTVGGAHLYPIPGKTSARIGGRSLDITRPTNASLGIDLSPSVSSGRVSVQTPYGFAESVNTVLVVPAGINPATINSRGVATMDVSPAALSITAPGGSAALMFESRGKQWVSVQLADFALTSGTLGYRIYAPGNVLAAQGSVATSTPTIHLPRLSSQGTYLVVFTTDTGTASFTASVESNKVVSDTPITVSTHGVSQSVRATFNAQRGRTLVFKVSSTATSPANANVGYSIYTANGANFVNGYTGSNGALNLPDIPSGGTWQVVAWPGEGYTGDMEVSVVKGATGVVTPEGSPAHFDAVASKQNVYFEFDADSLQSYELAIANAQLVGGSSNWYYVNVFGPAGNQVTSTSCYTTDPGGSCGIHLWYLPEGHYSVVVQPVYDGELHFDAVLHAHKVGRALPLDGGQDVQLGVGEAERLTFAGKAGQTVALYVSNATTAPEGQGVRFLIYRPDAGAITTATRAYADVTSGPSGTINLPSLPVDGDYTVLVLPNYGVQASLHLDLLSGTVGTVPVDGSVKHFDATVDRQNAYVDFSIDANQSYELTLSNASATLNGGAAPYYVEIYDASGRYITATGCNPGNCEFHAWQWTPGRYRLVVSANYGGILHFDVNLEKHLSGRVLAKDVPLSFDLGVGQAEALSFDANAGDTIALQVANVVNAGGPAVRFIVYRPDAGAIFDSTRAYSDFTTGASGLVDLPNLPVTGRYTILVLPVSGLPASGDLTVVSGTNGTVHEGDPGSTFETHVPGQSAYLDFVAGANEDLELTLTNTSVVGGAYPQFYAYVYDGVGRQILSGTCDTTNPLGNCQYHLWKLPAGQYRVTVQANNGGIVHFDAMIKRHIVGSALQRDMPTTVHLAMGEPEQLSFSANAGETVALKFNDTATVPSGTQVRVIVYRPDSGAIFDNTPAYSDFRVADSGLVNLPNLPATGSYRMLILPDDGLAASSTVTVMSGAAANLSLTSGPTAFVTTEVGQDAFGFFDIGPNQNLEVTFSDLAVVGATTPAFSMYVYDSAGRQLGEQTCYIGIVGNSCQTHMWQQAPGRYRFVGWANNGGTISFKATVRAQATGRALSSGAATPLSLSLGQPEQLTIAVHAGDNLTLKVAGMTTSPADAGVTFYVFRPDAGLITTQTPRYAEFTAVVGQMVTLPNLPVDGKYMIMVLPTNGIAASGTLTASLNASGSTPVYQPANIVMDGQSRSFTPDPSDGTITLTFDAALGENDEIVFGDMHQDGGDGYFSVAAFDPSGANVDNFYCWPANPACTGNLWNLKAGTYKLVARPTGSGLAFNVVGRHNRGIGALTAGVPLSIASAYGETLRATFHANMGDTVALRLDNTASTPAGYYTSVLVYRPDGGLVAPSAPYSSMYSRDNVTLNLSNLPATGDYVVVMSPDMTLAQQGTLTLFAGSVADVVADGAASHLQGAAGAQNVYVTVDTGTGGDFALSLNNLASEGPANYYYFYVSIYDPDGVNVANYPCYTSGPACVQDLWNARGGKYILVAQPQQGDTIRFDAQLRRNTVKGALALGAPADLTHGYGDVLRYTFHAEQGDTLALHMDGIASMPAGYNTNVLVYRPDGGLVQTNSAYSSFYSRDNLTLNLPNLPVGGDYVVVVETDGTLAGQGTLTLLPGATGLVVTDGVTQHFRGNAGGQNVYFQIDTGTGGDFEFMINNAASVGGHASYLYFSVFDSDGVNVDNFYCYVNQPTCSNEFWNMKGGVYDVIAQPQSGDEIQFDSLIRRSPDRGTLEPGIPKDLAHGYGEVLRMKFHGNLGDSVALRMDGIASTPAGYSTNVMVFRPDGGLVQTNNAYSSFYSRDSLTLNLPSLPVSGDYIITAATDYAQAGQGTLTLVGGVGGLVSETTSQHVQAVVPGQSIDLKVDVGIGGNLEFIVDHATSDGSSSSYYNVVVYDPDGVGVVSYYCYVSDPACIHEWWNMRSGVYSVTLQPQGGTPSGIMIGADASLTRNVELGGMDYSVPKDITHAAMVVPRATFQASLGDTVTLTLNDIVSDPVGRITTVSVYRPDGGLIQVDNPYARFNNSSGNSLTLPNLPVGGAYVVVIGSEAGAPAHGSLTVSEGSPP